MCLLEYIVHGVRIMGVYIYICLTHVCRSNNNPTQGFLAEGYVSIICTHEHVTCALTVPLRIHTRAKILTKTLTETSVHPLAVHRHTILIMHWRAFRARCFPSWHSREFVETFQSFALRTTDGWPFIIFEQNRVTLEPIAVVIIISSVNIIIYYAIFKTQRYSDLRVSFFFFY